MRKISILGLSVAVLAATGWLAQASAQSAAPDNSAPAASSDSSTPAPSDAAPAAPAKKMHHKSMKATGIHRGATKGDSAVEDLNAQSLSAAKSGTAFKPATTPTPEKKAPMKGMSKPMHHHHKMAPKPAADAAAPAPDASAPAPDAPK